MIEEIFAILRPVFVEKAHKKFKEILNIIEKDDKDIEGRICFETITGQKFKIGNIPFKDATKLNQLFISKLTQSNENLTAIFENDELFDFIARIIKKYTIYNEIVIDDFEAMSRNENYGKNFKKDWYFINILTVLYCILSFVEFNKLIELYNSKRPATTKVKPDLALEKKIK